MQRQKYLLNKLRDKFGLGKKSNKILSINLWICYNPQFRVDVEKKADKENT